jgi:hypothetical protein
MLHGANLRNQRKPARAGLITESERCEMKKNQRRLTCQRHSYCFNLQLFDLSLESLNAASGALKNLE